MRRGPVVDVKHQLIALNQRLQGIPPGGQASGADLAQLRAQLTALQVIAGQLSASPQTVTGRVVQGDGLVAPMNAAPAGGVGLGIQPGTSNGVITAHFVIVSGTNGGVFVYSGPPALGNLIASMVGGGGLDPFGNVTQAGITSYGGVGNFASLESGQVIFDNGSVIAEGAPAGSLWLIPTADLVIQPNNIEAAIFTSTSITLAQPVTATAGTVGNPTLITTDAWHLLTLDAGWTSVSGFPLPQYRLLANGDIEFAGAATHASFTINQNVNGSNPLAAAYRPANQHVWRTGNGGTIADSNYLSTGVIQALGQASGSVRVYLDGIVSLI